MRVKRRAANRTIIRTRDVFAYPRYIMPKNVFIAIVKDGICQTIGGKLLTNSRNSLYCVSKISNSLSDII